MSPFNFVEYRVIPVGWLELYRNWYVAYERPANFPARQVQLGARLGV
jgi:hypothetical protein